MRWRRLPGPALLFLCAALVGCNGRTLTDTPDYGTPALETPGPLMPQEQAYIKSTTVYLDQLFPNLNQFYPIEAGTPNLAWQSDGRAILAQAHVIGTAADAVPVLLRLRAIDEHYRAALDDYNRALAIYSQEVEQARFLPRGTTTGRPAGEDEMSAGRDEKQGMLTLLKGFQLRHPPVSPSSTP